MKNRRQALSIIFALSIASMMCFLTGCAAPTPEQEAAADCGEYPTNYEDIVKNYFSRILFDPYSAHYDIGLPQKGYTRKPPILGGGLDKYGYMVQVGVNAKNRFGAYVGEEKYQFLINNGVVIWRQQLSWASQ